MTKACQHKEKEERKSMKERGREGERERLPKTRQTKRQFWVTLSAHLCLLFFVQPSAVSLCLLSFSFSFCAFLFAFLSPTRDICINYHLFNKKKGDRIQRERDTLKWKWHQRLSLSFLPLSLSLSAGKLVIKVKCIK